MKFLPLMWAGLWRKPARTLLTLLSIVIAFVLFGLLQGVDSAFDGILSRQKLDRMFIDPRFGQPVPLSYKAQIEALQGIKHLTEIQFMPGYYQDRKNGLLVIFTRPAEWLAIRPEFEISRAQVNAAAGTRGGLIVTRWLAQNNGWKVGDHVTIKGGISKKDGSTDWTFEIVGIMHNSEVPQSPNTLANYTYVDEARASGSGTVSRYLLRVDNAARAALVAREIDDLFANAPVTTRTQSEVDQAQAQIAQIGDFKFFTRAIMGAVFFALLFLTLNTTMESVRERTVELATLKTLGFSDTSLLVLVVAESLAVFVIAAGLGLASAAAIFPLARYLIGFGRMSPLVIEIGAGWAVIAAVLSAAAPAWRARTLSVARALTVR